MFMNIMSISHIRITGMLQMVDKERESQMNLAW